ncbi:hypothetical protein KC319_g21106 [Hortaea werneckii]|nr:hypothetical protein KC317_g20845 [Hortaea werneckii]KAI7608359.1 hypothetical protein KC319_g21106 [Hortaea werneckii]
MLVRKMIPDEAGCFATKSNYYGGLASRRGMVLLRRTGLGRLSSFDRAFDNDGGVFFQFGKELVWQTDAICIFRSGRDNLNDRTQVCVAQLSKGQTFVGNATSAKVTVQGYFVVDPILALYG